MPSALPRLDALDDEEAFARLDQSEPPRLPYERRLARGIGELVLQLPPLSAKALDLPGALDERVPRVDVGVERPVVKKPDQAESTDSEPAADEDGAPRPTAFPL